MDKRNYNDIIKSYPIVFKDAYGDMRETCMAFGCECGIGWYEPINNMSAKLEQLNEYYYPRYGLRIQYDQIKEKYSSLTTYFSIVRDPVGWRKIITSPFKFISDFIKHHVHFKYERIVDNPGHNTEEWDEISKKDYDNKVELKYVSNHFGWKFKKENGKYYRNSCVFHYEKAHNELRNHHFLNWLMKSCNLIYISISNREPTVREECLREYLYSMGCKITNEARKEAESYCEICGTRIGEPFLGVPCETTGWITRICEDCAKKDTDRPYVKNGELWKNGKMIETKKERNKKLKKRFGDAYKDCDCQ